MARPAAPLPTTRAAITTMSPWQLPPSFERAQICRWGRGATAPFSYEAFFSYVICAFFLCDPLLGNLRARPPKPKRRAMCTFASAYYIYQLGAPDLRITLSQSKVLRRGRGEPAAQALSPEQAACRKPHAASPHAASAQRAGGRRAGRSSKFGRSEPEVKTFSRGSARED